MKKLIYIPVLAFLLAAGNAFSANDWPQEHLGLPGDNLNLFAVMNLFQESETLEAFERGLNDPERMINNLDLNGDNYVDYIMVFDYVEGDMHNIVLRVAINEHEYQDVAVFVVQRFADGSVQIQLIGDEALYGPNYIIEPNYAERPNPGYRGNVVEQRNVQNVTVVRTTYHEVAHWPVIVYMSRPVYRPWRSAWYWGYYPSYWHPWNPHYWHFYYGYHYNWYAHYYMHYRPWGYFRCGGRYRTVYYTSVRHYSPTVIVNVNTGRFRNTYSQPEQLSQGKVLYSQRNPNGRIRTAEHNPALMHGNDIMEAKRRVQPVLQGEDHGSVNRGQALDERRETQNVLRTPVPAREQQQRSGVEGREQQPRQVTTPQRQTREVTPANEGRQTREQRVTSPPARQPQTSPSRNVRSTPPQRSTPSSGSNSPSVSRSNRSSGSSPAVQRSSGSSSRQQPASVGSSNRRNNSQPPKASPSRGNRNSGSSATPARSQSRSNESSSSRPQRR